MVSEKVLASADSLEICQSFLLLAQKVAFHNKSSWTQWKQPPRQSSQGDWEGRRKLLNIWSLDFDCQISRERLDSSQKCLLGRNSLGRDCSVLFWTWRPPVDLGHCHQPPKESLKPSYTGWVKVLLWVYKRPSEAWLSLGNNLLATLYFVVEHKLGGLMLLMTKFYWGFSFPSHPPCGFYCRLWLLL